MYTSTVVYIKSLTTYSRDLVFEDLKHDGGMACLSAPSLIWSISSKLSSVEFYVSMISKRFKIMAFLPGVMSLACPARDVSNMVVVVVDILVLVDNKQVS